MCSSRSRGPPICGTDVHIFNWDAWAQQTIQPPMVIGHEFVGEIVEVGGNVQGFKPATSSTARATSLRPVPQLPRRAAASLQEHQRSRGQP